MVFSGEREEDEERRVVVMAMGTERSKAPLHNFNLPSFLKWGTTRHLRCIKVPDEGGSGAADRGMMSAPSDRLRGSRSQHPPKVEAGGGFKRPRPRTISGGGGFEEEGIEAVRMKIMLDLKTAADKMKDKMKDEILLDDDDDEEDDEEDGEDEEVKNGTDRRKSPAAASGEQEEVRPWNLRTRRAACKAPVPPIGVVGNSLAAKGSLNGNSNGNSPLRSESTTKSSPRLLRGGGGGGERRDETEKEKPRAKFAVALSRKEIEDDFMRMVGHRPARRPKKRPRGVQKQLDTLFPGLWLSEVTVDNYKVPEVPDTGKR